MMIKFSICIPAYKDRYLFDCIKSILGQSYQNFELIILNDCSPYPVEKIIKSFSDPRIQYYVNEKNVGPINLVENWNKCLALSSGEYVIMMGDDDLMEESYLSTFLSLIAKYPNLDVYHCRSKIIDDHGETVMLTPSWPEYENVYDNIWHRITERRAQYISDFVYRSEALRSMGGFFKLPFAWGSDDITAFRACADKGIAHTNDTVFRYRSNELSITSTGNEIVKMDANILYSEWLFMFLSDSEPNSEDGRIVRRRLLSDHKKLMQKRKIHTISKSLARSKTNNFIKWVRLRRDYGVTITEISYALMISVIQGRKKRYKN